MPNLTPTKNDFWFLPLGGCGEIGMNLNLYGHHGSWLMVDCGVTFDDNKIVMADPAFIEARKDKLVGIVATHAHQDHIGAMVEIWDSCRVPIYTTGFTANILRRNFAERGFTDVPIEIVASGETRDIGPFNVRWLPITHSTPETHALLIDTPAARVLHTADWKIDHDPVVESAFNHDQFAVLDAVDAVICDSTNAKSQGRSISEKEVQGGLQQVIQQAPGRVVVTCFASNVARLQSLGMIAKQCGRYIGVMGRSLNVMSEAGQACGYLDEHFDPISSGDLGYLPKEELLVIASGSQGEPRGTLARLARDQHPTLNLDPGDLVIFSARAIPGNEAQIDNLISLFHGLGVDVVQAESCELPIHASGHAYQEELTQMYRAVKPRIAIPVHGEAEHIEVHAEVAQLAGVNTQLKGLNGDLFVIAGNDAPKVEPQAVAVGRIVRR